MRFVPPDPETEDSSFGWLGSWKLQAVIAAFFTFGLVGPLTSTAPLVADYFPGAFIAMSVWSIIRIRMQWSPIRQPLLTNLPIAAYLGAATGTLFVAHLVTDRPIYLRTSLVSLVLTVPVVAVSAFIIVKRDRVATRATQLQPDLRGGSCTARFAKPIRGHRDGDVLVGQTPSVAVDWDRDGGVRLRDGSRGTGRERQGSRAQRAIFC